MNLLSDLRVGFAGAFLLHATLFMGLGNFVTAEYEYTVSPVSLEVSLVEARPEKEIVTQEVQVSEDTEKSLPTETFEEPLLREEIKSAPRREEGEVLKEKNPQQGALQTAEPLTHQNRPPVYPRLARQRGYEGTVVFKVSVSSKGDVSDLEIVQSSGYEVLDQAARGALRKWRFKPAEFLGIRQPSQLEIPVIFRLS